MNKKTLFVLASAIETWRSEAKKFKFKETGGILIGYKDKSGHHVITHTTGPGPKANHGITFFEADHNYCQRVLNKIFDITNGELTFLGDWHTHPFGTLELSSRDLRTMKELAIDEKYRTPHPVIVIYRPQFQILSYQRKENFASYLFHDENNIKCVQLHIIEKIPNYILPTKIF